MRVDFYIALIRRYRLYDFIPEFTVGDVKADAYFEAHLNGRCIPYFLEVQISPWRQGKYERLYGSGQWLDRWECFPKVLVISDYRIQFKPSTITYKQLFAGKEIIL